MGYRKMYYTLFNSITDALRELEKSNYGSAKELLQKAQQETEEMYLSAEKPDRRRLLPLDVPPEKS